MNEIKICVIRAQTFQTSLQGSLYVADSLGCIPYFGGDKQFFPGIPQEATGVSHIFFVFIDGSGVDEPAAGIQSRIQGCCISKSPEFLYTPRPAMGIRFSVVQ